MDREEQINGEIRKYRINGADELQSYVKFNLQDDHCGVEVNAEELTLDKWMANAIESLYMLMEQTDYNKEQRLEMIQIWLKALKSILQEHYWLRW